MLYAKTSKFTQSFSIDFGNVDVHGELDTAEDAPAMYSK